MPDELRDGGGFFIQSKATGKQLALPERPDGVFAGTGEFDEAHIVPRDRGAVWTVEFITFTIDGTPIPSAPGGGEALRLASWSAWPWSTGGEDAEGWGRLDSNHERQVYGHRPNDGHFQVWNPRPEGDGWWTLMNRATALALDGTADDIYTMGPNAGDFQRWGFFAAPPDPF